MKCIKFLVIFHITIALLITAAININAEDEAYKECNMAAANNITEQINEGKSFGEIIGSTKNGCL